MNVKEMCKLAVEYSKTLQKSAKEATKTVDMYRQAMNVIVNDEGRPVLLKTLSKRFEKEFVEFVERERLIEQ